MARPRDKAEIRKREILENFYQVLVEEGLEGSSIGKIAARMGIHPSLIIHYFSTKDEMIVELVELILKEYEETFLPRLEEKKDPEERLHAALDAIFGLDWNRLVDMGAFSACYSLSFRNERVRASFQRMYSTLREYLVKEIAYYMEMGLVARADPERLADLIIALMEGYSFYRAVMDNEHRFDELSQFLRENALAILRVEQRSARR